MKNEMRIIQFPKFADEHKDIMTLVQAIKPKFDDITYGLGEVKEVHDMLVKLQEVPALDEMEDIHNGIDYLIALLYAEENLELERAYDHVMDAIAGVILHKELEFAPVSEKKTIEDARDYEYADLQMAY